MKTPPQIKNGTVLHAVPFRLLYDIFRPNRPRLLQERERADQRSILRLAAAHLEEADDADDKDDSHRDRADDRDDESPHQNKGYDQKQLIDDLQLQRLARMEARVRGLWRGEQRGDEGFVDGELFDGGGDGGVEWQP